MTEKFYTVKVYGRKAHQVGDNYVWDDPNGAEDVRGTYATLGEACAVAEGIANEWNGCCYEIVRRKHGLDDVRYEECTVEVTDEDGDFFDWAEDVEAVVFFMALSPEVERAMRQHERDYWAYLDYKLEGYGHLTDYITE